MKTRSMALERLDVETPPPALLERSYRFLSFVNRRLGGVAATRKAFEEFEPGWRSARVIRVLDVASGSADIPRALETWNPKLRFTCLDLRPDPGGRVGVIGNALRLPFRDGAFDYVTTSLFMHHLDDEAAPAALKEFDRVARRGLVMNDLVRRTRLYLWTKVFTLFANEYVRNDGPLSVRKSFTVEELGRLAAPFPYLKTRVCFGHRVLLYGEKS
jgi:hypothetical protein